MNYCLICPMFVFKMFKAVHRKTAKWNRVHQICCWYEEFYVFEKSHMKSSPSNILLRCMISLARFNRWQSKMFNMDTAWKVSVFGVFLVCIFPQSDWIRRDTPQLSVFSPNAGKKEPENLQIRIIFTLWDFRKKSPEISSIKHGNHM